MRKPILFAALLFAAGGCSALKDKEAAEGAVTRFHQMVDAGQADAIYDAASADLKAVTSRKQFSQLVLTIHDRLGAVKDAKRQGWKVDYANGEGTATLTYATRFAAGEGKEDFVYRLGGAQPALMGYHITSDALVAK